MTRSDKQSSMQAASGDSVCRLERPVRKDRLHDLKAVRDPVDAADEGVLIHAGLGRGRKAEHDLRLDPGLGQALQRSLERLAAEVADRVIVDKTPDRRVDAVFLPDGPVGESDLAADGTLATRLSLRTDGCRYFVSILKCKVGIDFGERIELPTGPKNFERLLRDVLKIHVAHRPPLSR